VPRRFPRTSDAGRVRGAGGGLRPDGRLHHASSRGGWTLLAIGAITTIPLVAGVTLRNERSGAAALQGSTLRQGEPLRS
jgi:hypothetical protein